MSIDLRLIVCWNLIDPMILCILDQPIVQVLPIEYAKVSYVRNSLQANEWGTSQCSLVEVFLESLW